MLVFKYMPGNTDQIGRLRNQLAGAIFVYDFILIGESSTNSLLAFQMNLPLSFVMFSRKIFIKSSEFIKILCPIFDG